MYACCARMTRFHEQKKKETYKFKKEHKKSGEAKTKQKKHNISYTYSIDIRHHDAEKRKLTSSKHHVSRDRQ